MSGNDIFNEQIVKKLPTLKTTAAKSAMISGVILIFVGTLMVLPDIALYLGLAAAFGAYFAIQRFNKEYEYAFTNGELDIDVIYSKASRKRVFSGMVKDFEVMAHVSDEAKAREFSTVADKKDFSSGLPGDRTYAFVTQSKGKRTKIVFEPNEKMLAAVSGAMQPRKFIKKQ